GFKRSLTDQALYYRFEGEDFTFIPVYVDDLLLMANTRAAVDKVRKELGQVFKLKPLGDISTYLGVKVTRDLRSKTLALSLPQYTSELEKRFAGYLEDRRNKRALGSPMVPDTMRDLKLPEEEWGDEDRATVDKFEYMSMLGSLMFAALTCRPDLAFSVSLLSQAGQDPRHIHMEALVRVLQYLVATKDLELVYQGSTGSIQPCVFTDSDWGSEKDGLSRAGWMAKMAGAPITWYSKKLPLVATSSAEAEYKALSEGAKEAMWAKNLFLELKLPIQPVLLYCDNQSALQMSKNPVQHHRSRHFKLAWHLVRQLQEAGEVLVEFVRTALQDADILTKALPVGQHQSTLTRLGFRLKE
ncbi:transposon Pol polyprotein, partial [bacterium]|nr:transposon Pol polyprotein [bacterium]